MGSMGVNMDIFISGFFNLAGVKKEFVHVFRLVGKWGNGD